MFVFGGRAPQWSRASSFTRFLDHTQWRTTVGRTPLDEWSVRRRDLYLTTHNTHNRHIHAPRGIRNHRLSRPAAADLRLKPRGHWYQQSKRTRNKALRNYLSNKPLIYIRTNLNLIQLVRYCHHRPSNVDVSCSCTSLTDPRNASDVTLPHCQTLRTTLNSDYP
jgi:hypothetical protein